MAKGSDVDREKAGTGFEHDYWRSAPAVERRLDTLTAGAVGDDQFRLLADHIPALCWIANGDGYIVWYNRRWHDYCGTTAAQMEGWGWQSVHDPALLPDVVARWSDAVKSGEPFEMTFPLRGADGVFRPFVTRAQPVRDASGAVVRWFGANTEISEQVAAERAAERARLHQQALTTQQATILGQLTEGVIITDADGRIAFVNEAAERLHGVASLDVAPDSYSAAYHLFTLEGLPFPPDQLPLARAAMHGETTVDARWRIRRPDGTEVLAIGSARPLMVDGRRSGAVLTLRDDTERHAAETALRESEERLRLVLDGASDYAIFTTDPERRITSWSGGAAAIFGYPADQAIGASADMLWTPEDRAANQPQVKMETARTSGCANDERWHLRADGTRVFMNGSVHPLPRDANGCERGFIKMARDETGRRASEQVLRESEARFRSLADNAPMMVWVTDPDGQCVYLSRSWYDFTGQAEDDALGLGWLQAVHPDDRGWSGELFLAANAKHEPFRLEYRLLRHDGAYRWAIDAAQPRFGEDGRFLGYVGSVVDIDERREVEDALRASEALYRALADAIGRVVWTTQADGSVVDMPQWRALTGQTVEQVAGHGWLNALHPDDRAATDRTWAASVATRTPIDVEYRVRSADGGYRWYNSRGVPVLGDDGAIRQWVGVVIDIDDRKRAEAALRDLNLSLERRVADALAERQRIEEALRQSQKMEAVGQLTGGIAHDFNNLLTVITGNLDMAGRRLASDVDPRVRRAIGNAAVGAERAAVLTQRLLAFSRRQPLAPKPIDPNQLVSDMSDLLHRSLGEQVEVETVLAAGLWRIEIDPNQLENALLNLALNARDAMNGGGRLTIATANTAIAEDTSTTLGDVPPGEYVAISVKDTGIGMDPDTLSRAYEPFFTTKEVGKGTGLGLSMVYGFVKQSGGHVRILSTPGEGTIVCLYLPRLVGDAIQQDAARTADAPSGSALETILVCEDDPDVRAYTVDVLRELGYRVLEAADGPATLHLLQQEAGGVDLLFTDVVLPNGLNGEELARRARAVQPGLRILFTTGYARDAIVHGGRLDVGVELLTKPFAFADLAARVRTLLDAPAADLENGR